MISLKLWGFEMVASGWGLIVWITLINFVMMSGLVIYEHKHFKADK